VKTSAIAADIALVTFAGSPAWAADFRVTLLGTGTPTPRADRFSQSTLIEAGG
jgi:ribonuclease Z